MGCLTNSSSFLSPPFLLCTDTKVKERGTTVLAAAGATLVASSGGQVRAKL